MNSNYHVWLYFQPLEAPGSNHADLSNPGDLTLMDEIVKSKELRNLRIELTYTMQINKVNLTSKLEKFNEHWAPRIVGELNNQHVKIAKLKGEFVMHKHEDEDELFYVIDGQLFIELLDQTLELNTGEFVIIPRGVEHKPFAPEEVSVMLFEPATIINTGNTTNEFTLTDLDEI